MLVVFLLSLRLAAASACVGDCNSDQRITVSELVTSVRIALGTASLEECASIDRDSNHRVSVDELVAAVGDTLSECAAPSATRAFIVTSNFVAGSFATIGLDPPRPVSPSTSARRVYRDAVVRTRGESVYVLNRLFADNVQVLDPISDFATRLQCSTGNGTNPHDIAFVNNEKAYVTLFEKAELLIVNPSARSDCSDFILGAIDLSSVADADGIPDMDQMAVIGDRLYVILQHLDINTVLRVPAGPGAIAVIDTASDSLVDTIELSGENPFAATKGITVRNDQLYVSEAGEFNVMDGGIERVDLRTGRAEGFFVTEADLGGDITDFVIVSDTRAYAIVSRPGFSSALVAFDPSTAAVIETLLAVDGYTLFDIELNDRGELYLTDRSRDQDGVRIFRASDGMELTDGPMDVGLAPFEVVFIP